MNRFKIGAMSVALLMVAGANAQVNHFFYSNGVVPGTSGQNTDPNVNGSWFNHGAGEVNFVSAEDNDSNNTFSFDANFGQTADNKKPNAFWLVVSKGPNPKGIPGQLAAFYFDGSKGSSDKDVIISAYEYNGFNGSTSFSDGKKIATSVANPNFVKRVSYGEDGGNRWMGFQIDKSIINNYSGGSNWEGIDFNDDFGIWMHPVTDADTKYDAEGYLTQFNYDRQGWVDLDHVKTGHGPSPVPEPASMAVIGLGIAGLIRRRKSA